LRWGIDETPNIYSLFKTVVESSFGLQQNLVNSGWITAMPAKLLMQHSLLELSSPKLREFHKFAGSAMAIDIVGLFDGID
jgi:hypothetical protein